MCRLLFAGLICAGISNTHAGSPYDYDQRYSGANYRESFNREQVNPWASKPQVRQNIYNSPRQRHLNSMPAESSGPRFISEEELDALNNGSYYHGVIDTQDDLTSAPLYDQKRMPSAYNASPYARKDLNRRARPGKEFSQYRNKIPEQRKQIIARPSTYPHESFDPGQFGVPFAAPFDGIDTFTYE